MKRPDKFHRYFKVGRPYQAITLDYVPSWHALHFSRLGAWLSHRGLTLRYRGWLLILTVRP